MLWTQDEEGNVTNYVYDEAGRLHEVTDAMGDDTIYAYHNAGNLTSVTDANQHATSYTYDAANRLTRIDYPDGTHESFTYYDTGALYTRTDGNGAPTTYTRDALDRVTAIDYPGTAQDVTLTYDAEGRLTRMQSAACDTYYRYDSYGGYTTYDQLMAVERKYGAMSGYRATRYWYDANYNRISLTDEQGNGTSYAYDADNQLTQITRGPYLTTFQYDNVGNRTRKTLANGAYAVYNYNNRNWLTSVENRKSDNTLISSYAYMHDAVGNRLTMTEANGDVTTYGYDTIYRLITEQKRNNQQQTLYTYAYSYDGVGNRETMTHNGQQTSYSYDANNKLTSYVDAGGTTSFGYDGNGNTTSMTQPGPIVTTYGYDYENRLVSVAKPGYTANYTYAADGLRLRVQESTNPNPDRWMQYDGVRPVLESLLDSQGNLQTILAKYVWEGNSYYDPLVFGYIGGAWRHPLYDGLGSTRQLINQTDQAVTDTYSYEAFGNLLASTGTTPNPYRYVGSLGYYQTGSSLQHLGARYYMPEIGRFLRPSNKTPSAGSSSR